MTFKTATTSAFKPSATNIPYSNEYVADQNRGGVIGGVAYTAEKFGLGFLRAVEGIWDYVAGGIAEAFGAHQWAERQFKNDWVNYNHADEWYNPGAGWKVAGDVAGGIGTTIPAIAVNFIPGIGPAASAGLTFVTASTSAAGSSVSDAVKQTGSLTGKEWAYGTMSGVTEGLMETVTNAIGAGANAVIKSFGRNAAKTVGKRAALKTAGKLFAGEAFEEGMSEWLNPYYARATYDPNAKLATPSEVLYSSFVGGLSGLATGGAGAVVNNAFARKSGKSIAERGEAESFIKFADGILADDAVDSLENETVATLKDVRDKLKASLAETGGKVTTARQQRLLGQLNTLSVQATFNDALVQEAAYIVQNADSIESAISQYKYTDADGNEVNYTAADLTSGLEVGRDGKYKRNALSNALKNNIALRTLATQSAAGKLLIGSEAFADASLSGDVRATEFDYQNFLAKASDTTKSALAAELGVESFDAIGAEEFNALIDDYMRNGGEERYASRIEKKRAFEDSRGIKATKKIPARINMTSDGIRRFEANGENIAIEKDGDSYTVYDYTNRAISKPLTKDELNAALKQYARTVSDAKKSTQSADNVSEVSEVAQEQNKAEIIENSGETATKETPATDTVADGKTESVTSKSTPKTRLAEAASMAKESVKGYDALSERNKAMVRKVIRDGRAKGVSDDVVLVFANVASRSKIDVAWDSTIQENAYYDPHAERIVANPKKQSGDDVLIHELDHALRKTVKGGKVTTKIYERAIKATSEDTYKRIIDKYDLKSRDDMTEAERAEIAVDEANAYYAQNALGNKDIVKHLISERPNLKQRILDFFKGSVKDYQKVPKLERQAARYYKQFKKWFDEFAGKRRYGTIHGGVSARTADARANTDIADYKRITADMSDEERYEILKNREILNIPKSTEIPETVVTKVTEINTWDDLNEHFGSDKKSLILKIAKEFGAVQREYFNEDINISFAFSNHNFNESYSKQKHNYVDFAKMFSVFEKVVENAIGINAHNRRSHNPDPTLNNMFVLVSAYQDGEFIVPIKLEVKEFKDKKNSLYVAISLNKIKKAELNARGNTENGVTQRTRSVDISIARIFEKINPSDKSFLKYIPDGFLNQEQLEAKRQALLEDMDNDYKDAVNRGDTKAAQKMVDEEAKKAGYTIKAYHGTPIDGITVFDSSKIGSTTDDGIFGRGFYFSTDSMTAGNYATANGKIMPVFLAVKNAWWANAHKDIGEVADILDISQSALTVRKSGISHVVAPVLSQSAQFSSHLVERGYDAVVVQHGKNNYEISVFDNKQIKSADPVTYDDDGKIIPLSKRFDTSNPDIRRSVDLYDDAEIESITEPSIPKNSGYRFTVGQMQKQVANLSHYKVYSKKDILGYVKHMTGVGALSHSEQRAIADNMWQFFNSLDGDGSHERAETYASDMARYIVSRSLRETDVKKPVDEDAQRRLDALSVYIGRLTFTKDDLDNIRHSQDKDGLRRILGRWGYKGVKRGRQRVPMDVFVTDIAREMPELSDLENMHPTDAFIHLNELYEEAKKRIGNGWMSAIETVDDIEIEQMIEDLTSEILVSYEYGGDESKYSKKIEDIISRQKERGDYWKAMHDRSKQGERLRNLLKDKARRLRDLKSHKFANATQIENDTLDSVIGKLSSIYVQGTLSVKRTRESCAELLTLYRSETFKENVLEYYDKNRFGYYNEWVEGALEALSGEGTLGEMRQGFINAKAFDVYELKMLNDVMSYFINLYENYGKVWRNGQLVDAKPVADEYVKIAQENRAISMGRINGVLTRMFGSKYAQLFSDPASVVRRADLYNEHGFFTEMFDAIRAGAYKAEVDNLKIMQKYDDFLKNNKSYMKNASKEVVEYQGVKVPKIVLISLYCTSKRQQAQAGLAINGFQFVDLKGQTVRVDGRLSDDAKYTDEQIKAEIEELQKMMEEAFSDLDREYITLLEQIYNHDARRLKMERDIARQGFTNVSDGYYYPIKRANTAKSVDSDIQDEIDRVSNASFNKDVVKGAKQELMIESADKLVRRHVYAVSQYANLSPVIDSYNRIYNLAVNGKKNHPISVANETKNAWTDGDAYMRKLIKDVQGIKEKTDGSGALSFIRGGYAVSALGANPKVWFTQLSSLAASTSILDASSVAKGVAVSGKDVDQYCNLAVLRKYENTAAMAQAVVDRRGQAKSGAVRAVDKTRKAGEWLMTPIGKVDAFVVRRLFGACQVQIEKNSGGEIKIGTERNKIEAGKLLERVIFETQQSTISSEKSAAMRSNSEILKAVTMFSSDAMKVTGRLMDAFGELVVLKAKKAPASDIARARKKSFKATAAFITVAAYMVAIAEFFRWLYRKEEEEDENKVLSLAGDLLGNMLGGLPVIRDAYSLVFEGYDAEHYAYSAINNMVKSMSSMVTTISGYAKGEKSSQDMARNTRQFVYSVSQLLGLPARNVYNVVTGLTRRVSKKAGYKIDSAFYEKNYATDLEKAIEDEDDEMAIMIYEMLIGKQLGSALSAKSVASLSQLVKSGYKVMPRDVGNTLTIDGEEYLLTDDEKTKVKQSYTSHLSSMESLVQKSMYNAMTDEQKSETANRLFDLCYDVALYDALGYAKNNAVLLSKAIGAENVAIFKTKTKGITSDKDDKGKTVDGSKRQKFVKAVTATNFTKEQKLLLISASGYAIKDGDINGISAISAKKQLLKYILSLKIRKAEKERLAEMCGFDVKNGKIVTSQK